ncbi:MAG: methyltransferase domain-containing protein [Candidatus Diapherotrites archaeon]|nr:methyltransferase domain-containing protein [Candidatus Diapherotrites archaeon]
MKSLLDAECSGPNRLDLMSGTGLDAGAVALDLSGKMLGVNPAARKVMANIDPHLGPAGIPFPGNQFDSVSMVNGVRYLNRPAETFKEIFRVLRKGGKLVIINYAGPGIRDVPRPKTLSVSGLEKLLNRSGFKTHTREEMAPPPDTLSVIRVLTGAEPRSVPYFVIVAEKQ